MIARVTEWSKSKTKNELSRCVSEFSDELFSFKVGDWDFNTSISIEREQLAFVLCFIIFSKKYYIICNDFPVFECMIKIKYSVYKWKMIILKHCSIWKAQTFSSARFFIAIRLKNSSPTLRKFRKKNSQFLFSRKWVILINSFKFLNLYSC